MNVMLSFVDGVREFVFIPCVFDDRIITHVYIKGVHIEKSLIIIIKLR